MSDLIERQAAIDAFGLSEKTRKYGGDHSGYDTRMLYEIQYVLEDLPSAQPKEVIPHRNYKYLSDYWCECGWHLGKMRDVKYCANCGRKVNWDG